MSQPTVRAVAYYRMSTDYQEASIPDQKAWAGPACARENVKVVRSFEDQGIPGSEIGQRPDFLAMLAFCEQQFAKGTPIEAVVSWDADRFCRADSIRTAACISRLLDAGVTRFLSAEGWIDWTNDIDRVLYNLKQDLSKAEFSKAISKNVTRATLARAKLGLWVGSTPPYGYLVDADGRLALGDGDQARAEAVRWLFRRYCDSADSLADLARELNKRGLTTGRGLRWTRYSVRGILTNERYLGTAIWNETHKGKYSRATAAGTAKATDTQAREASRRQRGLKHLPAVKNDAADAVIIPNAHPALTDPETFERVRLKLRESFRHRTTPIEGGGEWALSGLLACGHCLSAMWGVENRARRKGKVYVYRQYKCSGSRRHGKDFCDCSGATQDEILAGVVKLLQEKLAEPGALAELEAEVARMREVLAGDVGARRQQLRAALDTLARQIDQGNGNLALLPADMIPGVVAKMRTWEQERKQAARELEQLEEAATSGADRGSQVEGAVAAVRQLAEAFKDMTPAEIRSSLAGMVKSVQLNFADATPADAAGRKENILDYLEIELREEFVKLLAPASRTTQVTIWLRGSVREAA